MAKDYYTLLGVSRDADASTVKKAYRKLAMRYHPDRNDSAEAESRFREATEAYEVLSDPEKRQLYDRFGEAGLKQGGAGFGHFDFADALDIFMREFGGMGGGFADAFRGGRSSHRPRRGRDTKVRVRLTLEEAATGVERTLHVRTLETCERCGGNGAEPGSAPERCPACGGAGEVRQVQRSMLGQFVSVRPCSECRGKGERLRHPCRTCRGEGRARVERAIKMDVPAGVSTDDYLKLSGRGDAGPNGGPRGDILVLVEVEPDPRFERHGDDLVYNLAITFSQAALGVEREVPTVDGPARLVVPAGIQSGQVLRLRGKGMPRLRGSGRGDQLVRVLVWTPTQLDRAQRAAFADLSQLEDEPPVPDSEEPGFWERVKRAFTA